jgi:hypothetical protein
MTTRQDFYKQSTKDYLDFVDFLFQKERDLCEDGKDEWDTFSVFKLAAELHRNYIEFHKMDAYQRAHTVEHASSPSALESIAIQLGAKYNFTGSTLTDAISSIATAIDNFNNQTT